MEIAGLSLHIILALICAVHAVRTGQPLYWLLILFFFPLFGSLVYLVAVILPRSGLQRGARRAMTVAVRAIDPGGALREARALYAEQPTAQHQMRLAAALLDDGQADEAARLYEDCLRGPFASDLEIGFGAARACLACGRHDEALAQIESLRQRNPMFRAEEVALLYAVALGGAGRATAARAEFESVTSRYGTFAAWVEYEIWARAQGDQATVARVQAEIDRMTRGWGATTRELNAESLKRLAAARHGSG
ncbi:MAG: hypothetical protein KGN16_02130 [Burkholderiales bacterium]|nr:hypothetical protein [Burkholderiales bacterium]